MYITNLNARGREKVVIKVINDVPSTPQRLPIFSSSKPNKFLSVEERCPKGIKRFKYKDGLKNGTAKMMKFSQAITEKSQWRTTVSLVPNGMPNSQDLKKISRIFVYTYSMRLGK